jgi:hypothetical protein
MAKKAKDPYENLTFFLILVPFVLAFIAYAVYGRHYESNYKLSDLKCIEGVVKSAEPWETHSSSRGSSSRSSYGVWLYLNGDEEAYKISTPGITTARLMVEQHLQSGVAVKVYTRYRFQQLIGMGSIRLVYHLEAGNSVVVDLKNKQSEAGFAMKFITGGGVVLFFLWLGYLIFYFKVYKKRKSYAS